MKGSRVYYYDDDVLKVKVSTARYAFALPFVKDKLVLDVGCGARQGPCILADSAKKVAGTDISYEAIRHCSHNWRKDNIDYFVADALRLPFKDGSFEAVLSFEVIEHLADLESYLGESRRVLKDSGMFILSTPNRPVASPGAALSNPEHVRELDLGEFEGILRGYFSKVSMYGQFPSDKVKAIESIRLENLKFLSRTPGFIKKILPAKLKEFVINKYNKVCLNKKGVSESGIEEGDFPVLPDEPQKARYLLAVCNK